MTLALLWRYRAALGWTLAVLLALTLVHANNVHQQRIGALNASLKAERMKGAQLSHEYAKAKEVVKTDTLRVFRTIYKYQTLRDTLDIHDTVQVKVFVAASDSVRRVCTDLKTSCQRALASADSLLKSERAVNAILMAQRPSKAGTWAKLGLAALAGYGLHAITHR